MYVRHPGHIISFAANYNTFFQAVVVAEWLRRWTRNPLGSPRAGSNPADYVFFFFLLPLLSLFLFCFLFVCFLFFVFFVFFFHYFLSCYLFCSYSSSGQLYNILRSSIQDAIDAGHFSVSETVTHQVSSLRQH